MKGTWRIVAVVIGIVVISLLGFSLINSEENDEIGANTLLVLPDQDINDFQRAIGPRDWAFPEDHGSHPEFQTEWWYYTGNLATEDGRRFGFQFTIFRRAITPEEIATDSEWRSNQVYFAHFTVSDLANEDFYHNERFSRAGADLAGAELDPLLRIWIEDWDISALNDSATEVQLEATSNDGFAIDLNLTQVKPPALQGDEGLSQKSDDVGNASYYYSLSRLLTEGTISIGDEKYEVSGNTWMDHEFSTSALGDDALGWDWFGLILDNDTELMVGQIRQVDGGKDPTFGGLMVYPDGSTRYLSANDIQITATDTWLSPHTNAEYPSGWTITIMDDDEELTLDLTPLAKDQELNGSNIRYWEGAVEISGDATGYGYAELTGYTDSMQGRF